MRARTRRTLRSGLRDMALGAVVFLMLPLFLGVISSPAQPWTMDEAFAGEIIATRAVEVSSPPGPAAENAVMAAALLRPSTMSVRTRRLSELAVLGLTFSLLVSFNLAFLRHLRRVSASPRRDVWRRRHP